MLQTVYARKERKYYIPLKLQGSFSLTDLDLDSPNLGTKYQVLTL